MSQPLLWPTKTFFYPIGNTPPIHLTANLPPEKPADVLLLACGDVRNILFTVFMESGSFKRKLDFTCNDHEPAILARNLLLYTMLLDDPKVVDLDKVWNIYYHFYLDESSLEMLYTQCRKVLELTNDLKDWNGHTYGQHIRFSGDSTLREIRRHCELYLAIESLSAKEKRDLESAFSKGMAEVGAREGVTFWRAAGPLYLTTDWLIGDLFKHYWKHGVCAGTQKSGCPYVNPLFAYSRTGRGFGAHYGSNPMAAFHLAPAFAPVVGSPSSPVQNIEQLVDFARAQFRSWGAAFQRRCEDVSSSPLCIRFLLGDVLSASSALRLYRAGDSHALETGVYVGPWGGSKIDFLPDDHAKSSPVRAPEEFDIIDTSNVTDHVGFLNILLATVPLLRRSPSSILFTHLLLKRPHEHHMNSLNDVGFDVPFISMVFGVVPTRILSNITTSSIAHEAGPHLKRGILNQFHDPLAWRFLFPENLSQTPPVTCDATLLAEALFTVYKKLFEAENLAVKLSGKVFGVTLHDRTSFCELLWQVRRTISADWQQMMDHLELLISMDRTLILGSNCYQDLICHLFLRGLHTMPALTAPIKEQPPSSPLHSKRWPNRSVPSVVCVSLVVPRKKLKVAENVIVRGTPNLQCQTAGPNWRNIHSYLRPIFGNVRRRQRQSDDATPDVQLIELIEDPAGWSGSSPLIVSFYMPAWILTHSDSKLTSIALSLESTVYTAGMMSTFGQMLNIFAATLDDRDHVFVTPSRLDNPVDLKIIRQLADEPVRGPLSSGVGEHTESEPTSAKMVFGKDWNNNAVLQSIVVRADISNLKRKEVLADQSNAVSQVDKGNHSVVMKYGPYKQPFLFPFPVDIGTIKTRIARKSSYIEVEASVQVDQEQSRDGLTNPFLVLNQLPKDEFLALLHMHYTSLDQLPCLLHRPKVSMDWIMCHNISCMVSDLEASGGDKTKALHDLKRTLASCFETMVDRQGKPVTIGLNHRGQTQIILFISQIRLDLHGLTVVLDACGIELSDRWVKTVHGNVLSDLRHMTIVEVSDDEIILLKKFLPAAAERCRTSWSHAANCLYRKGTIPLSTAATEASLCDCGRGKNLGPFHETAEWKSWAPFVTRMAVGPIFPSNSDSIHFTNRVLRAGGDFLEKDGKTESNSQPPTTTPKGKDLCWNCDGPGKPNLLTCSRCKKARYCSVTCQKANWKSHKQQCSK